MTVPMPVIEDIRKLDSQGVPWRQIAERLGVSRDSVAKYAQMEDFSPDPTKRRDHRDYLGRPKHRNAPNKSQRNPGQ